MKCEGILELSYMFLEVYQIVYGKMRDAVFKLENENYKVLGRGFYIIFYLLSIINGWLKDKELVELLSSFNLGRNVSQMPGKVVI